MACTAHHWSVHGRARYLQRLHFRHLVPPPCGPQTPLVAALWDSVGEGVKQESSDGSLPRDRPLRLQDPEATGRGLRGGDTFLSLALP